MAAHDRGLHPPHARQLRRAGHKYHRKLGSIIRRSLKPDSAYVDAAVHGDGLTSLQFRRADGGNTEEARSAVTGADVIQLERRGSTFVVSVAKFGDLFTRSEVTDVELGDEAFVGIFVCSHNADVSEQADFRNVRIIVPAAEDFVPIATTSAAASRCSTSRPAGARSCTPTDSLQAPNWTPDGKTSSTTRNGLLCRFDLATRTPDGNQHRLRDVRTTTITCCRSTER